MSNSSPVLMILAAGVGSRYGGLKQLDGFGPNNETIMTYSIYDAIQAGFKHIVLVIRRECQELFESQIVTRFSDRARFEFVYQETDRLPEGYARRSPRQKPWGTGHAILSAKSVIRQPFSVINADDFYGREAYSLLFDRLSRMSAKSTEFFAVGFQLVNTLSDHGSVSRGICSVRDGFLEEITEHTDIVRIDGHIEAHLPDKTVQLPENTIVSMNCWGFSPVIFAILETHFKRFLDRHLTSENEEFFITTPLDDSIKNNLARVRVLTTAAKWMGITYPEDKEKVKGGIRDLIRKGVYPNAI